MGRRATCLTALASVLVLTFVAGCGGSTPPPAPKPPAPKRHSPRPAARLHKLASCGTRNAPGAEPTQLTGLFSSDSVWNRPNIAHEPLGNQQLARELIQESQREIKEGIGPWIETGTDSTPIYVVGADQRCVPVHLDVTQAYGKTLSTAFARVPLPADAHPAAGSDEHLTLIQPSTDSLWEFWHLRRDGSQWRAAWGGAIHDVSTSPGYYTPKSWPGAQSNWGATATSLPVVAGTMTIGELERGHIDHALAMSLPNAREGVFAFPAQRTDGTQPGPVTIPEGTTFRLDPSVNLQSLRLPRLVRMMAEAAQRYGIIVRDKTLHAIGFYAEDPTPLGTNPYIRLFDGKTPGVLLQSFPWKYLQVVKSTLKAGAS